jgi:hypothetical protein
VIGGGPSLSLAQVRLVAMAKLEGRCRSIAVNDSIYLAWWSDWLHACDHKWWNWHQDRVVHYGGIRTCCEDSVPEGWAEYVHVEKDPKTGYRGGFPDKPGVIAGGGNGGYQAIQLAVIAGAARVLLLGFDMHKVANTPTHWFGDHPDKIRSDYIGNCLPNFPTLIEPLKRRGVEVINVTPDSAIDCFPKAKLEDVL